MKMNCWLLVCVILFPSFVIAETGHDHGETEHTKQSVSASKQASPSARHESTAEDEHNDMLEITLSEKIVSENNIKTTVVEAHDIQEMLPAYGKITPNQNRQLPIYPRFAGIIKTLPYQLGDSIKQGDILAKIESNESLQTYAIKAPFSGTIIKKSASLGEFVKPNMPIYELADLSFVWVNLSVYRQDVHRVKKDDAVYISLGTEKSQPIQTHIDYVSPVGNEHTQSILARATVNNSDRAWTPGLYVDAEIAVANKRVPLAIKVDAIQTLEGKEVVFVQTKAYSFKPVEVRVGLRDKNFVEIRSGLQIGTRYVSHNSFLLKAELEKSSAEHTH